MLRPKAIRRLVMLAAAASAAVASLAWAWRATEEARLTKLRRDLQVGLVAFRDQHFEEALEPLEKYIRQERDDIDALRALAESRLRVETPDGRHLDEAARLYRRLLELKPNSRIARLALLDIAARTGDPELLSLAENVLADDPNQPQALAARSDVLARQGRLDLALTDARRYAELQPQDLRGHRRVLSLMAGRREPASAILAYAQHAAQNSPQVRQTLLRALGHEAAGQLIQSRDLLIDASRTLRRDKDPDPVLACTLADELDRFFAEVDHVRPNESIELLTDLAVQSPREELLIPLARRLALAGRFDTALWWAEHGLDFAPDASRRPDELAKIHAWCLYELGRPNAAAAVTVTDSAWSEALSGRFSPSPSFSPRERYESLRRAISRDPSEPIFRLWLADAWRDLGEVDFALTNYRLAASERTWAAPHLRAASLLLEMNRPRDARAAARRAIELSADDRDKLEARLFAALAAAPLAASPADVQTQLEVVATLRNENTNAAHQLAAAHVGLLSRLNHMADAAAIATAATTLPLSPEDRVRLAEVCGRYELLDPVAVLKQGDASTVPVAYALALRTRDPSALDTLPPNTPATALAQVRLQTVLTGPGPALWSALGDRFAESLLIQQAVLAEAPVERMDVDSLRNTIERLKALTGDEATGWGLAKARLLLRSQNMPELVEAAALLIELVRADPRRVDTRLLLVDALDRTGNTTSSMQHLIAAAELDPPDPTATLRLIDRLLPLARYAEVRKHALRLAAESPAEPAVRLRLGRVLCDAGLFDAAIDLLATQPNDPAAVILRAEALQAAGRDSAADELLAALPSSASPAMIAEAALLADMVRQDSTADAPALGDALLARLGEPSTWPLDAWLAQAERYVRRDETALARNLLDRATQRFADNPQPYVARVALSLRLGEASEGQVLAAAALVKFPRDASLISLSRQASGQPLISDVPLSPDIALEVLADLAQSRPYDVTLQAQLVQRLTDEAVTERAVRYAEKASLNCVTDVVIAHVGAVAAANVSLWATSRELAERSLRRGGPALLNVQAATAEIRLGQPLQAVARLESVKDLPDPQRLPVLAEALVAADRRQDAARLLAPHLDDNSWARMAWLEAASSGTHAPTLRAWINRIEPRIDPNNAAERRSLAAARVELGRITADTEPVEQALAELQSLPQDDPATQFVIARLHLHLGHLEEAETLYRQLRALHPNDPAVANDLAVVLLRKHDPEPMEAMRLAEQAVQARPTSPLFLETLARSEWDAGHVESARRSFERSLALDPQYTDALSGLAKLEREHPSAEGRSDQLLRTLMETLRTAPPPEPMLESEIERLTDGQVSVME